jgi:hypothetical protein
MFKDMTYSKVLHSDFVKNPNNTRSTIELSDVKVLTNGNWPIDDVVVCEIPRPLVDVTAKFKMFYD